LGAVGEALGDEGDKLELKGSDEEQHRSPPSFEEASLLASGSLRSTTPASASEEDLASKNSKPSPPPLA